MYVTAYLLLLPLLYVSLVLGINGVKKIGAKESQETSSRYRNVVKIEETSNMVGDWSVENMTCG